MPDAYMTVEEVAELLKVSDKTVRRLIRRGDLPAFKVGNQWRFIGEQIQSWAKKQVRIEASER